MQLGTRSSTHLIHPVRQRRLWPRPSSSHASRIHEIVTPLSTGYTCPVTIRASLPRRARGTSSYAESQVRNRLSAGGRWIRTLGPPSAATPLSDRESPLQASFPRNLGLRFAPKASTPSRKSSELPRKVTGSSQRSPLHAAGTRRCLHFGKCACKGEAQRAGGVIRSRWG
jgi:hypothetical protein